MKNKRIIGIFSLAVIMAFGFYLFNTNANADTTQAKPKDVFTVSNVVKGAKNSVPNFEFTTDGKKMTFKEFSKGKVVFINFWGTWCPPCRREIPDIIKINSELSQKNFMVVGMASERVADPVDKVAEYATTNGLNYPNFIVTKELVDAFGGLEAVPTTFIVDGNGVIVEKIVGMRDKETFLTSIKRVLK